MANVKPDGLSVLIRLNDILSARMAVCDAADTYVSLRDEIRPGYAHHSPEGKALNDAVKALRALKCP